MTKIKNKPETPLPFGQFAKMTAPILGFGVIVPFVDIVTDLRMIIRLYAGVPRCSSGNETSLYDSICFKSEDIDTYCQENPGECSTERHPIFASTLLGKLNKKLFGKIGEMVTLLLFQYHFF